MQQKVFTALNSAALASHRSPDEETKVGAALLDENLQALATSWNGFIEGHCGTGLPTTRPDKYSFILHAERKLLFLCARQGIPTEGRSIVCTLSPCPDCLRAMWQAGVKEVYFRDRYRSINESFTMNDLEINEDQLDNGIYRWQLSIRQSTWNA